jgi:hypothetical protein
MIDKIKQISSTGEVTFIDKTTGKDSAGTLETCNSYGFTHLNNKCFAFTPSSYTNNGQTYSRNNKVYNKTNDVYGKNNEVSGYNNCVKGFSNNVTNNHTIVMGSNLKSDIDGAIVLGNYDTQARSRFYFVTYSGQTTNDTATELFTIQGNRFFIDENVESVYHIETTCVVLDSANNEAAMRTNINLYKYTNNTLTEVLDTGFVNAGDSGLNAVALSLAPVAGTPDYIEIKVTGIAGRTLNYNVVLKVTEVTNV